MLKVYLHAGALVQRTPANLLATLDIGYAKRHAISDYLVTMTLRGSGELEPASIKQYPRWSASLWDLVARAIAQLLYRSDTPPSAGEPDRRCAYATHLCAVIEKATFEERGIELGTVEITQAGRRRGQYVARFTEDILGERSVEFAYGRKNLNHAELLMRAICWALFEFDVPGRYPALVLPAVIKIDDIERFDPNALPEPARTGYRRFAAKAHHPGDPGYEGLPRASHYVSFLLYA